MARLLAIGLLILVPICGSLALNSFDVTRLFSLSANSTCGEGLAGSGEGLVGSAGCLPGQHNESFALDGDLDTWWRSEDGVSPVELLFNLENVCKLELHVVAFLYVTLIIIIQLFRVLQPLLQNTAYSSTLLS